jgi:hypothetical protein
MLLAVVSTYRRLLFYLETPLVESQAVHMVAYEDRTVVCRVAG